MMIIPLLQITPPKSFTSSPPTPPPTKEKIVPSSVSRVLAEIRRHKEGHRLATGEYWLRFSLDLHQFEILQSQLRKDDDLWYHYEDKLRHDYFPLEKLFVLRMPGPLHEIFGAFITHAILLQLGAISQGSSPSAVFARDVVNSASTKITFKDTQYGSHEPDASFLHMDAQYPGVILEVSHSQKKKDLSRLADEYILGSDANIRVMIGIDVEYKGSKKASISVWRPHIKINYAGERELCVVQTVTDQLFRDDAAVFVPESQASLRLQLEDFGNEAFAVEFPVLTGDVYISAEQLFAYLERAEGKAKSLKDGEGLVRSIKPWVRKRGRNITPPEQLHSDREANFVEQEESAAEKAIKDDSSYEASSSDADRE